MDNNKKTFQDIYNINVNDKVEKKGRFSYLSWAFAWAEIKKLDGLAEFKVLENANGLPFFYDSTFPQIGAFVKVEMTFQGLSLTETHPILDNNNKSVAVDKLTSFMINTSVKRALAKVASLHGLGLYIYAGEDLPEVNTEIKVAPVKSIDERLEAVVGPESQYLPNTNLASQKQIDLLKKHNVVANFETLTMAQASKLISEKVFKKQI